MGSGGRAVERASAKRARADELAVVAFQFLAADPARIARFFNMTGISSETIRSAAEEPRFFAGVLDHVIGDEPLLLAFCRERGVDPNEAVEARHILMEDSWERGSP
jgi:hypothetical protein